LYKFKVFKFFASKTFYSPYNSQYKAFEHLSFWSKMLQRIVLSLDDFKFDPNFGATSPYPYLSYKV